MAEFDFELTQKASGNVVARAMSNAALAWARNFPSWVNGEKLYTGTSLNAIEVGMKGEGFRVLVHVHNFKVDDVMAGIEKGEHLTEAELPDTPIAERGFGTL